MQEKLELLAAKTAERIKKAESAKEINELRVEVLGKNGELTLLLKGLKDVSEAERPFIGKLINETRSAIEQQISQAASVFEKQELNRKLLSERIDITIDKPHEYGKLHPLNVIRQKAIDFFVSMGFTVAESPEIEYTKYNFDMLNIPEDHPARAPQDTFFITDNILLRTQTSAGQVRVMEKYKPPIKMISPGRVFRSDEADATHTPCFHQLEGLVVDKGITMCDLKGILGAFARNFFSAKVVMYARVPDISKF